MNKEMVIFTRTYDFITWLIPLTLNFPRSQRFIITKRLQDAILDFYELILEANGYRGKKRIEFLYKADTSFDKVRHYLRLCQQLNWLKAGQYKHAANLTTEIGRLLGGWIKQTAA